VRQNLVFDKFFGMLERVDMMGSNFLRVLTYHRVLDPEDYPYSYQRVTVKPNDFDQQMCFLVENYQVISMDELLRVSQNEAVLPPRAVMVTFDDGYNDFAENAWPILKKYRVPVTLFVPTAYPDHPEKVFWWDKLHQAIFQTKRCDDLVTDCGLIQLRTRAQREQSFSRMRDYVKSKSHEEAMDWVEKILELVGQGQPENQILSWGALRQLTREGVTMGAHTRTHPMMDRISIDQALVEAYGSLQDLEREIGSALPIFAYPSGHFSEEVVRGLKDIGFKLAFTTERGLNDLNKVDWLRVRRINIGPSTSLPVLRAQLLSWAVHLDRFSAYANT
jgi:peptidoglycan/xylan/chitin deacetylase (PgdA/CDA1 family)